MTKTPLERLFRRRKIDGSCWLYDGYLDEHGYGVMGYNGKNVRAHIVAYKELVGPIPTGMQLDHVKDRGCKSKACWNPNHLEPVTQVENMRRGNGPMAAVLRTGKCKRGHSWIPENIYIAPKTGGRNCKPCMQMRTRVWNDKVREERLLSPCHNC